MLHLLIILCYCVYQNGMKVKQWEIQEEHTAHVLYICLRERTSYCKVVISWLSTIPRHLAQKRVEVFTEYCNLNNQSFKTEIMHQLNEHNKACHVICKQLLNLLQKFSHTECIPDVRWDTFPSNKLYIQTTFSILGSKQPLQTVNILSIA